MVDANGDGALDITMVGNHYTREPETGLWRGTLGTTLLGDGKGGFNEVDLGESGFVVAGDGKSLAQTDLNADVVGQIWSRLRTMIGFVSICGHFVDPCCSFRACLQGKRGNLCAVGGACGRCFLRMAQRLDRILLAGSGYLSQSGPECFFGLGTKKPKQVTVRWPQGDETVHPVTSARLRVFPAMNERFRVTRALLCFFLLMAMPSAIAKDATVVFTSRFGSHGSRCMGKMQRALEAEGYRVVNVEYPSRKHRVEELAKQVRASILGASARRGNPSISSPTR